MTHILLEVPDGPFCWRKGTFEHICQFFDNPTGYPECKLGFDNSKEDNTGVLKPLECTNKEVR